MLSPVVLRIATIPFYKRAMRALVKATDIFPAAGTRARFFVTKVSTPATKCLEFSRPALTTACVGQNPETRCPFTQFGCTSGEDQIQPSKAHPQGTDSAVLNERKGTEA